MIQNMFALVSTSVFLEDCNEVCHLLLVLLGTKLFSSKNIGIWIYFRNIFDFKNNDETLIFKLQRFQLMLKV